MDTSNALAVLADPTRRAIIERLASSPCSVSQLRDALPVTLSAVSQHLKLLRAAGLVTATRRGRYSIYRVDAESLDGLLRYLGALRPAPPDLPDDTLEVMARIRAAESPHMDAESMVINFRIEHIFRVVEEHMKKRVAARSGLTLGEILLLGALGVPPYETSPTRLKDLLWVTLPGVGKRVDRLVARGHIEVVPHPDDRRGRVVRLTAKGHAILEAIRHAALTTPAYLALSGMPCGDRHELARLLKELQRAIELHDSVSVPLDD